MNFKRWNATAAMMCTLYFQAFTLAEDAEVQSIIETLVIQAGDPVPTAQESPENPGAATISGGKIVIQLPGGETREITLPPRAAGDQTPLEPWVITDGSSEVYKTPKFVIGVSLSELPDSLRAHLALPEGVGVMVGSVTPDGPAAKVGVEKYDILLKAGDRDLKHPNDLREIVDGSEIKPVTLTLQRKGEQKTVEMTPIKREELKLPANGEFRVSQVPVLGNLFVAQEGGEIRSLPQVPARISGVIPMSPQQSEDLTNAIRRLTDQIEKLQQQVDRLEKERGDEPRRDRSATESEKGEGGCRKVPRRELLTSFTTVS